MKGKKITSLILFLFVISLMVPVVFAESHGGVSESIRKVSDLFWGTIDAFFTPEYFQTADGILGFLRFVFSVLVFTAAHLGLSRIPGLQNNNRHTITIALIMAAFVFLIPEETLIKVGATYSVAIIFFIEFGLLFAIFYVSWIIPRDSFPSRLFRVILIFFGIMLLIYVKGSLSEFVDLFQSNVGGDLDIREA